jgi:hypothetical protein
VLIRYFVELPVPADAVITGLQQLPATKLVEFARNATSYGEGLYEESGLERLDQATRSDLHVQLGRPTAEDSTTAFHIRWWNEASASATPSVDGELEVGALGPRLTELAMTVQYNTRTHLRELVDRTFLCRMSEAVVKRFLDQVVRALELPLRTGVPHRAA